MVSDTVSVDSVRPVEVLWLRTHREDARSWDRENSLRAVLMDLSVRGLLEPEDDEETFEPTEKARSPDRELRSYERELLEAIEGEDDQQAMVDAVYDFEFEDMFISSGVLREVEKSEVRSLPLIPESWYSYTAEWTEVVETDLYDEIMSNAGAVESKLSEMASKRSVRADMLPMMFAYPGVGWFEDFDMGSIDECVVGADEVESMDVDVGDVDSMASGVDGAGAAAVAASSAGACAAASSACASSAAGACAGGAAGAGAGAGGAAGGAGGAGGV